MRLKDKVAIITGGSRGIGFATVDKFLKEGATVVLAASSKESADTAVDKLKEKYSNAIVAGISPNLASMESVRKAFKEAIEKYGCVDILANNAGISENTSFMDYTEETFDKVMDLNVKGVFNTTRVAAECMVMSSQKRNKIQIIIKPQRNDREDYKMTAININKNNFQNEVMNSDKTVLLDFWAPWCAPCRMVVPIIEEIAGERPDIKVGKINVDEQSELASEFSIMSIPTLVVMKNGKIVQQVSGARPKKAILEML